MMFIQFLIYYPKRLHSSMHTHQRGTTTKPQTFSWKGANNNDDKIFKKTRLTQAGVGRASGMSHGSLSMPATKRFCCARLVLKRWHVAFQSSTNTAGIQEEAEAHT